MAETLEPASESERSEEAVEIEPGIYLESPTQPLQPITNQEIRVGIDFGTTTTGVSLKLGDQLPVAALIGRDREPYIPSIVYFEPGDGTLADRVVVGEEAENRGTPGEVIRSVKRCLGCKGTDCQKTDRLSHPWCVGNGKIRIRENEDIDPAQIVYFIIREAILRAINFARDTWQLDISENNVILFPTNFGCGTKFNFGQRLIIRQVATELGFKSIKFDNIVEEPILAGFTYARFEENPWGNALIYDFGGGTFDTAIINIDQFENNPRITVISSDGNNWLGGDDIDTLIMEYFLEKGAEVIGETQDVFQAKLSGEEMARLRQSARQAKERLSNTDQYSDILVTEKLGFLPLDLTREKFEELLSESKLFEKSIEAVLRACKLAYAYQVAQEDNVMLNYEKVFKLKIQDANQFIDKVVLVGGITKIPVIRAKLAEIFGESKLISEQVIEPISAVSIGASYPREPQHFSLSVPPFGFVLEYRDSINNKKQVIPLIAPYEYNNFHERLAYNSCPIYQKRIFIKDDIDSAEIQYKRADQPSWQEFASFGRMGTGEWDFCVELEGNISFNPKGKPSNPIGLYPIMHPLQEKITQAKQKRQEEEHMQQIERTDSQSISMVTEN